MNPPVQLVTLAPGHFHAALVQKEMLPGVDANVHVYAPDDADLAAHLGRIADFNSRADRPTAWITHVHAAPDWLERFLAERPGNAVVIAGRNRPKIDLILEAVSLGYCVLADKPWIVEAVDFPRLERAFTEAKRNGVFVWDMMTERWEVTSRVQRELMSDREVFGDPRPGTAEEPAVLLESVHYLSKHVAGVPLKRPAWWFDLSVAGEAMSDVGTHLADLSLWLSFPAVAIDHQHDVEIIEGSRWPTLVDREAFREITALPDFPPELAYLRDGDRLTYWGNGSVLFRLRDRLVRLTSKWGVRSEVPEGDTHLSIARGSRSSIIVQHDARLGAGAQVFVVPNGAAKEHVLRNAQRLCRRWSEDLPGYEATDLGDRIHIQVPDAERTGHESHFASVLAEFIRYFHNRSRLPAWEEPNLLAKYYITTQAVERARSSPVHAVRLPSIQRS